MSVKLIAEIGINANGDVGVAKKLIDIAEFAGFDYVKFQKRTPEACVPERQRDKPKKTPWGEMTYLEYKKRIEFGKDEYDEIFKYCEGKNVECFASVWDKESVEFMSNYTGVTKIPSALLHDLELVNHAKYYSEKLMLSTGMSDETEIKTAYDCCRPDVLFHTCSAYPSPLEELNLEYFNWMRDSYADSQIGYSGHEYGLATTFAAVAMGVEWVERHVTLDRTMWGSDQMASIEPGGMIKLVKGVRDIELSMKGGYGPRRVMDSEKEKRRTLRGV